MAHQVPVTAEAALAAEDGPLNLAAPDIAWRRVVFVNVIFLGQPGAGDRNWVLVDAGLRGSTRLITGVAAERFGEGARPACIFLTHGHFDHVGTLADLIDRWDVPIYAHPLERPHLDGTADYPPPNPSAGGGLLAWLSPLFPRGPVDVARALRDLPADGSVPTLPDWRWLHTPGHSPGHVSFWRACDRALVAGDAFITTANESAYAVATQEPEVHGPPKYFTPDWTSARASVEALAGLDPALAVTGHGPALHGPALAEGLRTLARDFDALARPDGA